MQRYLKGEILSLEAINNAEYRYLLTQDPLSTVTLSATLKALVNLRSVLHSALIVLMFLSPLQASVHTALMSSQDLMDSSSIASMAMSHHGHEESVHHSLANHHTQHQHSDLPCMELCLMVSIVSSIPLVESPITGISPTTLTDGKPLSLAQPTAPPPKQFLL